MCHRHHQHHATLKPWEVTHRRVTHRQVTHTDVSELPGEATLAQHTFPYAQPGKALPHDLSAWGNPSVSRSCTGLALSQALPACAGLAVPGRTGSSASLAQGTAGHPCDTSVTPTSALFQAGEVSAGSCKWLMMTAGNVASPWRSFALCQCFAGNKGQDGVSVGVQNSEFFC